jgi:hypothetical protein
MQTNIVSSCKNTAEIRELLLSGAVSGETLCRRMDDVAEPKPARATAFGDSRVSDLLHPVAAAAWRTGLWLGVPTLVIVAIVDFVIVTDESSGSWRTHSIQGSIFQGGLRSRLYNWRACRGVSIRIGLWIRGGRAWSRTWQPDWPIASQ